MSEIEPALAVTAVLLLIAIGASKLTGRVGVPVLLLFIGIGMLAGSDGVGGIEFTDYELAQSVGITALAFILFSGGLDTDVRQVRPALVPALSLATVGVAITCGIVATAASAVLDLPWQTGLLVGAVVSSTDAAAVFSVLRAQSVGLDGELRPTLELESGSNDPMAVFLTVGALTLITEPDTGAIDLLAVFVRQMALGAVLGYVFARAAVLLINKLRLDEAGLYPVLTVAIALAIFGGTAIVGGSGFLAVYLAGIVIGNTRIVHRHSILQFHDALAWLSQIVMFLVLGLLAFPSDIVDVAGEGLVLAVVLVAVARPVATFIALPTRRFTVRGRLLLSWVGLRGAVPIVLATFALAEGVDDAVLVFEVVFFIVLVSVAIQGTTVARAAHALGVATPADTRRPSPLTFNPVDESSDMDTIELVVHGDSVAAGSQLLDLGLPRGVLALLVTRDGRQQLPEGSTVFAPGDVVLLLASAAQRVALVDLFETPVDARD